ncbi:MAG: outer membrane beta-barrel protein [Opitutaceae bacterium]
MNPKTIFGAAAALCVSTIATAESGFLIGDAAILHLVLDGQIRYDDNVELTRGGDDDVIYIVAPGVELNYNGGLSKAFVGLTEQIIRYGSHKTYAGELFSGLGEYSYEGAACTTKARVSYRELSQASTAIQNRDQAVRHDEFASSLDSDWVLTGKTRFGAGLFYNHNNYPGSSYADLENYGVPVDLYYAATPKVDVSLGYRYRVSRVKELASATQPQDSKDEFFNIGARGEFTPKLKGQLRVGYGLRTFDHVAAGQDDSDDQFSFESLVTYVYSPKTSFDLELSKDFRNSVTGISQKVFRVRAGGKFEFTPEWSAVAGVSYEASRYATGRDDDFITGDVGVLYTMNENLSFNASYLHRVNFSTYRVYDFSNNVLSVGITLRY